MNNSSWETQSGTMSEKSLLASSTTALREYATIWLVACVGLTLTILGFALLRRQLETHRIVEFEWVVHNRIRALETGIRRSLDAVQSLDDLIRFGAELGEEEFALMAESVSRRTEGLEAVLWAPREAHETAGKHMASYPIRYVYSAVLEADEVGRDLASNPNLVEALQQIRQTGVTTVSGRLEFGLDGGQKTFAFAVLRPLNREGDRGSPSTPDGVVAGVFPLSGLAKSSIDALEPRGVDCLIRDESTETGEEFLTFYASRLSTSDPAWDEGSWRAQATKLSTTSIPVANRKWSVTCAPTTGFRSAEAFVAGPWVALAAGFFFTLLLTSYLIRSRQSMLQRLAMESSLRESEELFWQMTETVSEVFWATTPERNRFLYISPAFEKVWGVSCDDLYQDPNLFLLPVHPEDQDLPGSVLAEMHRSRSPTEVVFRLLRSDRSLRWIRDRAFPVLDPSGEISHIVGFAVDITDERMAREALRQSEERLRDLFNQSPDIILTVDREGKVLFINRSTPELASDFAIGRSSEVLLPEAKYETYRSSLDRVFDTGEIEHFAFERQDGTWWEIRMVPLIQEGATLSAMVIVADVTKNRSLQDQAARNARLASIGVLAAGVAHEINNPNNAIQFNASVLSRAWSDAEPILNEYFDENGDFALAGLPFSEAEQTLPELLAQITKNSNRIQRIVESLKHLSRKDQTSLFTQVDLNKVLVAAIDILREPIQENTESLVLDISDPLPRVHGNSQQLVQIFTNVILNALQALPSRECGILITATTDPLAGVVAIHIKDEGEGISKEHLEALTEPFFSTKATTGGTGLGLSISQSLIGEHQGTMVFESRPGEGTTVTIEFPIAEELGE